ncbi:MAG: bifunctional histidinol-phosphatase/imidazoleglycerol-phosphate dehydratase HisB [Arenimonas sp.]|uniref:bifunctional histidinol-phosphatase/imidazoleglycerol-phosphate dehydratase HisB n=1 Tax=Arenimonas sp. TaxID=1872635 RepID=UPI0025C13AF6|nr:bifunctional histidinol-phosphatase/imidazoleglycerol-phosphate dehydratase HisB [Arenimonas sp.]MBW8369113.1 bifunctional histidinol-phosphatase/imidazoleglycerol-phosphate dehydratase HisB [Arenimonas sp.]
MSAQRILFVDRDGTIIEEPADFQIDAYEKIRFVEGVIPAMLKLRDAGFEFVLVTNQDGLGTASFPRESFTGPHALMVQVLESQGIRFREELIDESFEDEGKPTRKPGLGLLMHYLRDRGIDLANSAVVGDRDTDLQLAANLGCRGFKLKPGPDTWAGIAHALADAPRIASVERTTKETRVRVTVDLDRAADPQVMTGLGFFDHMLEQLGKHGGFSLQLSCAGDLHIDEHHTVEDSALALGQALKDALADKRGIARYGDSSGQGTITLPMDETLATAAVDFSGRPYFVFEGEFPRAEVGGLATELVPHFFRSLCETSGLNLHLKVNGENTHHMVEACFKAVARALRQAIRRQGRELPSTKGTL